MYTGNSVFIKQFIIVFTDGLLAGMLIHMLNFVFSRLLCRKRLSDTLCTVLLFVMSTGIIYKLNRLDIRYYFLIAYILSFMVYRYSFYYLINDVLTAVFSFFFRLQRKIFTPAYGYVTKAFSPLIKVVKKTLKNIYALLHQTKKLYNNYIKYFAHTRRRKNEEEQKAEKSGYE